MIFVLLLEVLLPTSFFYAFFDGSGMIVSCFFDVFLRYVLFFLSMVKRKVEHKNHQF